MDTPPLPVGLVLFHKAGTAVSTCLQEKKKRHREPRSGMVIQRNFIFGYRLLAVTGICKQ